ncbi:hypothetical protein GJ700_05715 [Duganella sp. FT92W]|uniref:Uncharacterized protein n=1 Tax=Pseudoduganella rivuli TaxID=2666085 RepID=A0A7X2IJZ2_9BURK|nr:hypothetical protein [Pseudoduganella rivuli]MRV71215.1 hypothetical protein [Pseudoduganella rivuli]
MTVFLILAGVMTLLLAMRKWMPAQTAAFLAPIGCMVLLSASSLAMLAAGFGMATLLRPGTPEFGWHIGPAYAAMLAALTCAALVAANHLWTPARLISALKAPT